MPSSRTWKLALTDSLGCVVKRFLHVGELKVRIGAEDLVGGHALGDHADNGRDGDPQGTDARDAVHLVSANGDAREVHRQRVPRPVADTADAVGRHGDADLQDFLTLATFRAF